MQFITTLSVAFFAALATAHQHAPHHFHMRRGNYTSYGSGPSTTLIVYATTTETIHSCPVTVTDCPAHPEQQTSDVVITKTVPITTTVCPVSEIESASSAAYASITAKPSAPLGTGSYPTATAVASGSDSVVLTYTLGTGTSTTVVTTTIKHFSTATVYATSSGSGESEEEPTTTISQTSTSTKYITVYPATTGDVSAATGSGECVPVTVTVAATTVTVTETAGATSDNSAATSVPYGNENVVTAGSSDVVIVPSTVSVIPVPPTSAPYATAPYNNGTDASGSYTTKTKKPYASIHPSGFVTKPAY